MTMISVWYDADCDQIWITDADRPYPARSLVAFIDPATSKVGISLKAATAINVILTEYNGLTDHAGLGFLSALEAKAYLDGEFAKQRPLDIPSVTATASTDIPAGMPVVVSRGSGALIAARGDTYALAFVAGLLKAPVAPGFVGEATRNALTLPDWTAATGAPSLNVGQPYFLGSQGGLTTTPDHTPSHCLVRVGNATGPQTLAPVQADPILL